MCADMLTVLLHQLFGKGEVKATPASCFQRGVLCVYPQATIKASREPRIQSHASLLSNRNTRPNPIDAEIAEIRPKAICLIRKA